MSTDSELTEATPTRQQTRNHPDSNTPSPGTEPRPPYDLCPTWMTRPARPPINSNWIPLPRSFQLDGGVFEWFIEERTEGRAISNYQIQMKGRELANQLRVDNFLPSNGWLRRWKHRFSVGIQRGTNDSQKLPSDHKEKVAAFLDIVRALRQRHGYTSYNIANMDHTMVRFDSPNNATVRITNTGGAKKGCTVAWCGTASGHKLPAYIIFKGKAGELSSRIRSALAVPPNVRISATPNGWMTTVEVQRWISSVWGPNSDDIRRILTMDRYRPHTCPGTMTLFQKCDRDIVTIPGGCTGLIEPMDTHVNKVFKQRMRQQWATWFETAGRNKRGNFIQPTRQHVIDRVSYAWECVTESTILWPLELPVWIRGRPGVPTTPRGIAVRDIDKDLQEELDAARAHGILFDSDESDDETPLFGGFGPND